MHYFLISIIFSLLSLVSPEKNDWKETKSDSAKISFKMPLRHQHLKRDLNGIKSEVFQTKDLTCVYGIVASHFKGRDLSKEPIEKIYEAMKEGSLYERSAVLKSERSLAYKKMIIKEIKYSVIRNKKEYVYYKRLIFRKSFAYQISIGAFERHINELEANKEIFFNSIDFSE